MPAISVPYTFSPNTTIQSGQVNSNFASLVNAFNNGMGGSFSANGYVELPGQIYLQWGKVSNAPADGSAQTNVSFPLTFPNNVWAVYAQLSNPYQVNAWELSVQTTAEAISGFNVNVAGGISTGTANVWWAALGN